MPVVPGRRPVVTPGVGRVRRGDVVDLGAARVVSHRLATSKSSRLVVWRSVDGRIDNWRGLVSQPRVNHAGSWDKVGHVGVRLMVYLRLSSDGGRFISFAVEWKGVAHHLT